jgi:DNA-binding transcriptional MerR regulator
VCVCYVLYESLTRTSLPQMVAIQVVQSACVHALADKNMPVSEISRYLATESPREELTARACSLLGTRETPELQQRIDSALRSLRIDVKACADQIESRLSRAKAAGGR